MFAKSKISQSMIDAVNKVLGEQPIEQKDQLLNEAGAPIKEPTPTGVRVYGSSYGNSAKAKKDQTKSPVDNLKGPKDKEMKEAAKPDFLDMDKDGNKKEPMKKAIADKSVKEELKSETFEFHLTEGSYADLHKKWGDTHKIEYHSHTIYPKHTVTKFDNEKDAESHAKKTGGTVRMNVSPKMKNEELKGNQHRIDANNNDKIDAQDFKILKAKKKVKEGREFTEKLLEMVRKSDVPAYLRKAKGDTPLTMADVKAPKKDSISAPENLAKARNEEVELTEEQLDEMINEVLGKDASAGDYIHDFVHSDNPKFAGKSKAERKKMALGAYYGAQKEAYEPSDDPITTDTLAGRMPGGKSNSFKSFKTRVRPLDKEGNQKPEDDTPKAIQPQETPARKSHEVKEATIAGTPGWEPMKKDVKDKSGAVHTPMSRAKDLARQAFKTVQNKTKVK